MAKYIKCEKGFLTSEYYCDTFTRFITDAYTINEVHGEDVSSLIVNLEKQYPNLKFEVVDGEAVNVYFELAFLNNKIDSLTDALKVHKENEFKIENQSKKRVDDIENWAGEFIESIQEIVTAIVSARKSSPLFELFKNRLKR